MNNLDKFEDWIQAYLDGQITDDDRKILMDAIKDNPELKSHFEIAKDIYMGMAVENVLSKGHIDSELIAEYSLNPDDIETPLRNKIKEHIDLCDECRDEYLICRSTVNSVTVEEKKNIFISILNWFVSPRLSFRPVTVFGIIIILLIPLGFMNLSFDQMTNSSATYTIEPIGTRGDFKTNNEIIMGSGTKLVTIEFNVDFSDKNYTYDFELLDNNNLVIMSKSNNSYSDKFVFEIPASYLIEGKYQLLVKELSHGAYSGEEAVFPITVKYNK